MKKLTSLALVLLLAVLTVFPVSAFTLDSAETSDAYTAVLAEDGEAVQKIGKYGIAIMEHDFSSNDRNKPSYLRSDLTIFGAYGDSANLELVPDPAGEEGNQVLKIYHPNGTTSGFRQVVFGFESTTFPGIPLEEGTYTFVYDQYAPTGDTIGTYMARMFFKPNGKDIFSWYNDSSLKTVKDVWVREANMSVTVTKNADGTFTAKYGSAVDTVTALHMLRICIQNANIIYFDNVGLYFVPKDTVVISNGDEGYVLENIGATYTFPKPSDINPDWADKPENGAYLWLVNEKDSYLPGQTVDASVVLNNRISLDEIPVAFFDEKHGDLVLFMDYDVPGAGYFTHKYRNAEYMPKAISELRESNALKSLTMAKFADGNTAVKFDNSSTGNSGYGFFNYKIEVPVNGIFTTKADVKAMSGVQNATDVFSSAFIRLTDTSGSPVDKSQSLSFNENDWTTFTNTIARNGIQASGINISVKAVENIDTLGDYYYDNFTVYTFPYDLVVFKPSKDSTEYIRVKAVDGKIKFPTPEELGLDIEDFVLWSSDNAKTYYAGDEAPATEAGANVYYPFSQTADAPAMGYVFEADVALESYGSFNYGEVIEDDGRTVTHLHQYNVWNPGQSSWSFDVRISMYGADTAFDPKEYPIVEYMYKIGKATKTPDGYSKNKDYNPAVDGDPVVVEEPTMAFWYATPRSGDEASYWIANNGENKIGGENQKLIADGKYHQLSYDMRFAKSNDKDPFLAAKAIGGFALDPCTSNWENDVYIDYIRVYRSGLTTVTYDTNAPADATNVTDVTPDENRGLGTGYLLTGRKPSADGYIFAGWAESADAGIEDVVESIDLVGDTTVYAVWVKDEEYATPEFDTEAEIRGTGSYNGIRFKSYIKPSVKENLDEFGFIATREVLLPKVENAYNYDALTFLFKESGKNENLYVKGIAYDADGGIDIINSNTDEGDVVYTAVVSGIPLANKNENMVVRAYAVFDANGQNITVYGSAASATLYDTAMAIKTAGGDAYNVNKAYIDLVLAE